MNASNASYGGGLQQVIEMVEQAIHGANPGLLFQFAGARLTSHLQTEHRLSLLKAGPSPSEDSNVSSVLQMLYFGGTSATARLTSFVKETFGVEVALDYSVPQKLRLRIGKDLRNIPADPRDALPFMRNLEELDEQGDGLRSFVAVLAALSVIRRPVCLIDEPEAFLHPPQAYAIGRYIADHASAEQQIIVSTHSADVLRGILSVTTDAAVVRIDRQGSANLFRPLAADRLKSIATDPLLASARVFDGLFSAASIVVEADADARFYQVILNKIRINANVHFVNADNKQTVPKIMELYKEMGVRTAGIVDFDVLNNAGEFSKQIDSLGLSPEQASTLARLQQTVSAVVSGKTVPDRVQRLLTVLNTALPSVAGVLGETDESRVDKMLKDAESAIRKAFEDGKPWAPFKERGVELFDEATAKCFDEIDLLCSAAGLFINRFGELESMLTEVGIAYTSDKRAVGSTPQSNAQQV
jgi:hypothetical protein